MITYTLRRLGVFLIHLVKIVFVDVVRVCNRCGMCLVSVSLPGRQWETKYYSNLQEVFEDDDVHKLLFRISKVLKNTSIMEAHLHINY